MTEQIFDLVFNKKKNLFLSGVGGTGKSYQIKKIYDEAQKKNIKVVLTSTTGVSAFIIGGTTIHSWSGITLPSLITNENEFKNFIQQSIKKIHTRLNLLNNWKNTEMIIIDEVSMLGLNYFDLLNCIAKSIRNNNLPFGGIQLILSGDLCQLPPVKDGFVFESFCWEELKLTSIFLKKAWRFTDQNYIELLQRIRIGSPSKDDLKQLESRLINHFKKEDYENAVHVFPLKKDVELYNKTELDKVKGIVNIFTAKDTIKKKYDKESKMDETKDYDSIFTCPKHLNLKIGCRVMLLYNLNVEDGLVNGSVGIVKSFQENVNINSIEVFFESIKTSYFIERQNFVYDDHHTEITRYQFPLTLAYAASIHKLQGSTLDKIVVDIGNNIFEDGQTYVALSRCKNLNSLFLKSFSPYKIKSNKDCIQTEKKILQNAIFL